MSVLIAQTIVLGGLGAIVFGGTVWISYRLLGFLLD